YVDAIPVDATRVWLEDKTDYDLDNRRPARGFGEIDWFSQRRGLPHYGSGGDCIEPLPNYRLAHADSRWGQIGIWDLVHRGPLWSCVVPGARQALALRDGH